MQQLAKSSKDGDEPYHPTRSLPAPGMRPKKGILKKTPSFNFSDEHEGGGLPSSTHSTVTSTDSRWRRALEAIVQKAHTLHDNGDKSPGGTLLSKHVTLVSSDTTIIFGTH